MNIILVKYYVLGVLFTILVSVLIPLYPYYFALIPFLLLSLKMPTFFFAVLINGMFLFSYFAKEFVAGFQTIGAVGLAAIGTLLHKNKKNNNVLSIQKKLPVEIIILFTFGLYLTFSLIWSNANNYGLFKVEGFWLGIFIPFVFLYLFIQKDYNKLKSIINLCVIFSVIASILLFIENRGVIFGERTTIDNVNSIWIGRYIGVGLIISYYNCFVNNKVNNINFKFLWFGLTIFFLVALLVNGSRGPLVASIITIILVESILVKRIKKFSFKTVRSIFIPLLIMCILILSFDKIPRFQNLFSDENVMERIEFIESSILHFIEKPVFGWGIGGFGFAYKGVDDRIYPHNIIFEIGLELGIVGLIFFLFLLIRTFVNRKYLFTTDDGRLWTSIFIFFFVNSLFSGDLFGNATLWLPLAAVIQIRNYNRLNTMS